MAQLEQNVEHVEKNLVFALSSTARSSTTRSGPTSDPLGRLGPEQDLVTPAKGVISTVCEGYDHNPSVSCGDSFLPDWLGYGPCTGTSIAALAACTVVSAACSEELMRLAA